MTDTHRISYIPLAWGSLLLIHALRIKLRGVAVPALEFSQWLALTGVVLGPYLIFEGKGVAIKTIGWIITVPSALALFYFGWGYLASAIAHTFTRRQIEVVASSLGTFIILIAPPSVGYYRFRTQRTKARVISQKLDLFEKQALLRLPAASAPDYQEQVRRFNAWAELEFRRSLEKDIRYYFERYFIHPREQSIGEIEVKADEFISNLTRGRALRDALNGQLKIDAKIRFTLTLWFKRLWHSIVKDATK
jgi:hypothetical protein